MNISDGQASSVMDYESLPLLGAPFTAVETYVYYDGRQTFTMRSTLIPDLFYIVNTVDESDDGHLTALAVAVDTTLFQRIRSGAIPFRDAFEKAGPFALHRIDWTFAPEGSTTVEITPMRGADVPSRWLPTAGVSLNAETPISANVATSSELGFAAEAHEILGRNLPQWMFTEDIREKSTVHKISGIVDLMVPLFEAARLAGMEEQRNAEVAALTVTQPELSPLDKAVARFEDALISDRRHTTIQSSAHLKKSRKKLQRALAKRSEDLVDAEKAAASVAVTAAAADLRRKSAECAGYFAELRAAEQEIARLKALGPVGEDVPAGEAQADRAETIAMLRAWEVSLRVRPGYAGEWHAWEASAVARRVESDDVSDSDLEDAVSIHDTFEADPDRSSRVRSRGGRVTWTHSTANTEAVTAAGPGRIPRNPVRRGHRS